MKDELFCPKCNADLKKQFGFCMIQIQISITNGFL